MQEGFFFVCQVKKGVGGKLPKNNKISIGFMQNFRVLDGNEKGRCKEMFILLQKYFHHIVRRLIFQRGTISPNGTLTSSKTISNNCTLVQVNFPSLSNERRIMHCGQPQYLILGFANLCIVHYCAVFQGSPRMGKLDKITLKD